MTITLYLASMACLYAALFRLFENNEQTTLDFEYGPRPWVTADIRRFWVVMTLGVVWQLFILVRLVLWLCYR